MNVKVQLHRSLDFKPIGEPFVTPPGNILSQVKETLLAEGLQMMAAEVNFAHVPADLFGGRNPPRAVPLTPGDIRPSHLSLGATVTPEWPCPVSVGCK